MAWRSLSAGANGWKLVKKGEIVMNFDKAPRASEVIKAIQLLIDKHGDLPVCADDPDTAWRMRIGIIFKQCDVKEERPDRFEIKTDYHIEPKGLIGEPDDGI